MTRNSTASHSDTGSFSWPESAGLALPRDQRGHLDFEGWQDVLGYLNEVGFEASLREGLDDFDADEPGAEDDGSRSRGLAQGEGVVDRTQGVHARGVEALDRGPAGEAARGEDQVVVCEGVVLTGLCVNDLDAAGARINRRDLGVDAHVEVESRFEGLRGCGGGAWRGLRSRRRRSTGVRSSRWTRTCCTLADDLGPLVAPTQACRRAHATLDSSDDNYSHMRLTFWLEDRSSSTVLRYPRQTIARNFSPYPETSERYIGELFNHRALTTNTETTTQIQNLVPSTATLEDEHEIPNTC